MYKSSVAALLLVAGLIASAAYGAVGNLVVFDDADENGFDHNAATCVSGALFNETAVVHSGSVAIAMQKFDNSGAGWVAPATYSATTDYDGVSFWIDAGNNQTSATSLAVYDAGDSGHFLHLEDAYGGPLPANTWVPFQIPFSSPLFAVALSTPPANVKTICVINHSSAPSDFLFLDQVALTGADIFLSGFEH
jgi:hypothetical protein